MNVTPEQLIEAAEANGYIHIRSAWMKTGNGISSRGNEYDPVIAACFLGQIALNLGVEYIHLQRILDEHYAGLGTHMMAINDSQGPVYSFPELVKQFKFRIALVHNFKKPKSLRLRKRSYVSRKQRGR